MKKKSLLLWGLVGTLVPLAVHALFYIWPYCGIESTTLYGPLIIMVMFWPAGILLTGDYCIAGTTLQLIYSHSLVVLSNGLLYAVLAGLYGLNKRVRYMVITALVLYWVVVIAGGIYYIVDVVV